MVVEREHGGAGEMYYRSYRNHSIPLLLRKSP
jgi:hypothetical protein